MAKHKRVDCSRCTAEGCLNRRVPFRKPTFRVVGGVKPYSYACLKHGVALCSFDSDICSFYVEGSDGCIVLPSCCSRDSFGKLLWVCPRYDADLAVLLRRYLKRGSMIYVMPLAVSSE
jgi:hypothetical protein